MKYFVQWSPVIVGKIYGIGNRAWERYLQSVAKSRLSVSKIPFTSVRFFRVVLLRVQENK